MESIAVLNAMDYAIILIVTVSILISLVRGFLREAISLATWVVAFWIAIRFTSVLALLLTPYIESSGLRSGFAFFVLFIVSLMLGAMINFLVSQMVVKTGLSGSDRSIGMVFGFGRGLLIVSFMLLLSGLTTFSKSSWWQSSMLIPHFKPIVAWMNSYVPQDIGQHEAVSQKT